MSLDLFHRVSHQCSKVTTRAYSTSFSSAIKMLHPDLHEAVYDIYGFVRLADEIVDTFHTFEKKQLLEEFKNQTFQSIRGGISLNPVLNSFQITVNKYAISEDLIVAFFKSMEMDLDLTAYDREGFDSYIYGSAEAVGLMCLHVFCTGNKSQFTQLTSYARALGAAFQKVNFLRDINADFVTLSRTYFPGIDLKNFTPTMKLEIEKDIENNFSYAYKGISMLPWKARFGVYVAYKYYLCLFRRIQRVHASRVFHQRIRIPGYEKALIVMRARLENQLNLTCCAIKKC